MSDIVFIPLNCTPEQFDQLRALQEAFAEVCNAIAPVVQQTRCWNRVALHHLVYRTMRERFPALGSQMICNAVYSVSRLSRFLFQHPDSPWSVDKRFEAPLPLMRFAPTAPVYFDRHTLSLKGSTLSMFTLDGRIRFDLRLPPTDVARFHRDKLVEIVLRQTAQVYELQFQFGRRDSGETQRQEPCADGLPEYLLVIPPDDARPFSAPTPVALGVEMQPLGAR
jgi:hypothetical protein